MTTSTAALRAARALVDVQRINAERAFVRVAGLGLSAPDEDAELTADLLFREIARVQPLFGREGRSIVTVAVGVRVCVCGVELVGTEPIKAAEERQQRLVLVLAREVERAVGLFREEPSSTDRVLRSGIVEAAKRAGVSAAVDEPTDTEALALVNAIADRVEELQDEGHGCPVKGREAEELRAGLEALQKDEPGDWSVAVQTLLDRVDARDSLAFLNQKDERAGEGTDCRGQRDILASVLELRRGEAIERAEMAQKEARIFIENAERLVADELAALREDVVKGAVERRALLKRAEDAEDEVARQIDRVDEARTAAARAVLRLTAAERRVGDLEIHVSWLGQNFPWARGRREGNGSAAEPLVGPPCKKDGSAWSPAGAAVANPEIGRAAYEAFPVAYTMVPWERLAPNLREAWATAVRAELSSHGRAPLALDDATIAELVRIDSTDIVIGPDRFGLPQSSGPKREALAKAIRRTLRLVRGDNDPAYPRASIAIARGDSSAQIRDAIQCAVQVAFRNVPALGVVDQNLMLLVLPMPGMAVRHLAAVEA